MSLLSLSAPPVCVCPACLCMSLLSLYVTPVSVCHCCLCVSLLSLSSLASILSTVSIVRRPCVLSCTYCPVCRSQEIGSSGYETLPFEIEESVGQSHLPTLVLTPLTLTSLLAPSSSLVLARHHLLFSSLFLRLVLGLLLSPTHRAIQGDHQ